MCSAIHASIIILGLNYGINNLQPVGEQNMLLYSHVANDNLMLFSCSLVRLKKKQSILRPTFFCFTKAHPHAHKSA